MSPFTEKKLRYYSILSLSVIRSHFVRTVIDGSSRVIWIDRALLLGWRYWSMPEINLVLSTAKLTSIMYIETREKPNK